MQRCLFCAAAVAVLTLTAPAGGPGSSARELLSEEEMGEARGGVMVAGDVAFEFGAVMKTFEDGVLSLETQVTWTPQGAQVQRIAGPGVAQLGRNIGDVIAKQVRADLAASAQGGRANPTAGQGVSSTVASVVQAATQNAGEVAVGAGPDGSGAFVTSSGANVIQQVSQGQLLNILLNSQSDRQFSQSTEVTLTLPGFAATQERFARQIGGARIADEVRAAMVAGSH